MPVFTRWHSTGRYSWYLNKGTQVITTLTFTKRFQPKYQMSRDTIQICFSSEGKIEISEMDISLIKLFCLIHSLAWDDKRFVCLHRNCWRSIPFFTWRWGTTLQHENQNLKRRGYRNVSFSQAMCTGFKLCSPSSVIVHPTLFSYSREAEQSPFPPTKA